MIPTQRFQSPPYAVPWRPFGLWLLLFLLSACTASTPPIKGEVGERPEESFALSDIIKTDLNIVVETNQREVMAQLRLLTEKLYRRNPTELRKQGNSRTVEEQAAFIFDPNQTWIFPELNEKRGVEALQLAFDVTFKGDRVMAFSVGLASMIFASYEDKKEFFMLDSLDPQKLYNSARNLEIAAWKLSNDRDLDGNLFLISNETEGPVRNLSYERLFGKMIALQDIMARNVAQKTKRTIKQAIQMVAAVFLPI